MLFLSISIINSTLIHSILIIKAVINSVFRIHRFNKDFEHFKGMMNRKFNLGKNPMIILVQTQHLKNKTDFVQLIRRFTT